MTLFINSSTTDNMVVEIMMQRLVERLIGRSEKNMELYITL